MLNCSLKYGSEENVSGDALFVSRLISRNQSRNALRSAKFF